MAANTLSMEAPLQWFMQQLKSSIQQNIHLDPRKALEQLQEKLADKYPPSADKNKKKKKKGKKEQDDCSRAEKEVYAIMHAIVLGDEKFQHIKKNLIKLSDKLDLPDASSLPDIGMAVYQLVVKYLDEIMQSDSPRIATTLLAQLYRECKSNMNELRQMFDSLIENTFDMVEISQKVFSCLLISYPKLAVGLAESAKNFDDLPTDLEQLAQLLPLDQIQKICREDNKDLESTANEPNEHMSDPVEEDDYEIDFSVEEKSIMDRIRQGYLEPDRIIWRPNTAIIQKYSQKLGALLKKKR